MIRNSVLRKTRSHCRVYERFWLALSVTAERRVCVIIGRHA